MADRAEIGSTGLNRFSGEVIEEFLTELRGDRGRKIYEEMRSNDAIVGAILFSIEMALREVPWFAKKKKGTQKQADFLESCMHDMSHTWADFISEVLLMLPFGYSYFELVYKGRKNNTSKWDDGMIGWRKFGYRAPDSIVRWDIDDAGPYAGKV